MRCAYPFYTALSSYSAINITVGKHRELIPCLCVYTGECGVSACNKGLAARVSTKDQADCPGADQIRGVCLYRHKHSLHAQEAADERIIIIENQYRRQSFIFDAPWGGKRRLVNNAKYSQDKSRQRTDVEHS
jgi:hypothetical protein